MDKFIHNLIKIKYTREGYLPNYPHHLISDVEMCDAFLNPDEAKPSYFYDNYPCLDQSLQDKYNDLVSALRTHIDRLKSSKDASYELPEWVYSYMLGSVISINSPELDKHDLFVLMNMDNIDDEFTADISASCYELSKRWLSKLPMSKRDNRVPTMFGEPHVIKYLRLLNVGVV